MARYRTIAVLPTLFTLGNLVCGFFAIVVAANLSKPTSHILTQTDSRHLMFSGWLIFLAMVFDALVNRGGPLTSPPPAAAPDVPPAPPAEPAASAGGSPSAGDAGTALDASINGGASTDAT